MLILLLLLALLGLLASGSKEVVELQGTNFELALSTYKYVAVLFFDDSKEGQRMRNEWAAACASIELGDMAEDSEMASISGADPDLQEIVDAYGIVVPSIKVFRRGVMAEYRGPTDSAGIAQYVTDDSQPSVKRINSMAEMKAVVEGYPTPILFGLIEEPEILDDSIEGYGIDAWGQFHAAADSLRGHASLFVITAPEVLESFKLNADKDLPVVYMVSSETAGFVKYQGEILDVNLSEWVLRNSAPTMDELTLRTSQGELYAAQFFSSRKLKFILFLNPTIVAASPEVLQHWQEIADLYKGLAIFSYMTETSVADVTEYFDINTSRDIPVIVAHHPGADHKFKSVTKIDPTDAAALASFVGGVVTGKVQKVLTSEPVPPEGGKKGKNNHVVKAVGSTVIDLVSRADTDVLLAVFAPWCQHCKKLLPTYDVLGRAVAAEPRIVVAKINGVVNDIPASWGVKEFPTLLWFPASDKPYADGAPVPRPYWDAGFSLMELVGFVQRESSFDPRSLRVATSEQLGSLLGDEEQLREEYEQQERREKRNEGRVTYENAALDYLLGEVAFDGKVWHVAAAAALALLALGLGVALALAQRGGGAGDAKKASKKSR